MPCVMSVSSNIPGRLSPGVTDWVCSGAGATAGHLIWSSARVLLSRGAAHAQTSPGPEGGRGCSVSPGQPPDRKRAAKYNLKCWHDSNSGKLRGAQWETRQRGHSYISVTWVRREGGPIWSLVMVNSDTWPEWGSGDSASDPSQDCEQMDSQTWSVSVIASDQTEAWTLGHWSLVEIERLNSGQWLEGTENFCQE